MPVATARQANVYKWDGESLEWALQSDIVCSQHLLPIGPNIPYVVLHLVAGDSGQSRLGAESHTLLAYGDLVAVCFAADDDHDTEDVFFEGFIVSKAANISPGGEGVTWIAKSKCIRLQERFPVGGRTRGYGDFSGDAPRADKATMMAGLSCILNPGGIGNASSTRYTAPGFDCPVFAPPGDADLSESWTYATALEYLLQSSAQALDGDLDFAFPDNTELEDISALQGEPRDILLDGLSWWEATNRVASAAGCRLDWETSGTRDAIDHALRIWQIGAGPVKAAKLQAVGELLDADLSQVSRADLNFDASAIVTTPSVLGAQARWEGTWPLMPGWETSLMHTGYQPSLNPQFSPGDYESHYVVDSANWLAYRDVGRLWVLNEAGQASAAAYGSQALFDLSSEVPGGVWARRPRPLRMPISVDFPSREGLPPLVEISFDAGATWQTLTGCEFLATCAGIRINAAAPHEIESADGSTDLWTVLTGASPGDLKLCVTASLDDDGRRVGATEVLDGCPVQRQIDLPYDRHDSFGRRTRIESGSLTSSYYTKGYSADSRSDADETLEAAQAIQAVTSVPTLRASLRLEDVDYGYQPGDRISGIEGRDISFDVAPDMEAGPVYPEIIAVNRTFGSAYVTELVLEDHSRAVSR